MEIVKHISELPELTPVDIHIWGIHVPDVLGRMEALHAVLNQKEQDKAARFYRDRDRHTSIAARGALRILLGAYSGQEPAAICFEYSENGKPFLVPSDVSHCSAGPSAEGRRRDRGTIEFNVSHSGDWVVLAFGRNRKVGVDVERIRREMDVLSIASRYFTPEEAALIEQSDDVHRLFFHHWCRKEAYIKAIGSALFRELSTFSVPNEDGEKDGWFFYRLEAGSDYAAAVVTDYKAEQLPCFDFSTMTW
jgi:4'-phosphopantetheinyl transferase